MHSFILEDWLTISGPANAVITQEEMGWLDLEPFQDVILYLECREATGSPVATILFQTAPTKEETLFQSLLPAVQTISLTAASAPQVIPALLLSATVPLARFLRWQVTGPNALWDATFRVLVAANSPGM